MTALLYKGLYRTATGVEASTVGASVCSMSSVTENLNILDSEFRTHVSHSLTGASVRMLALYLEHVHVFCL